MSGQSAADSAMGPKGKPAAWPQALVLLCINSMHILASASLVPSLPTFMKQYASVPGAGYLVPMIITLPTLCIGLFSTAAGAAADRWGRRPLILGALVLFTCCGLAPMFVGELRWILVARFGIGVAEACMLTAGNALMGDYFAGEARRKWLSFEMVAGAIVGAVVLLSAGLLSTIWWRAPFAIYLFGVVLLTGATLLLWEPARRDRAQARVKAPTSGFPWGVAATVAFGALVAGLPFFTQNTQHGRIFAGLGLDTPLKISLFGTMVGVGTVTGALTFRKLPRDKIERALALVFGVYAFAFVGLSFHPPLWVGTLLDVMGQFACGMCYPAVLAWSLSRFPPEFRGRGVGVWSSCFYVSSFFAGLLVGFIDQYTDSFLQSLGVIGYGCAALSALLLVGQLRAAGGAKARPVEPLAASAGTEGEH